MSESDDQPKKSKSNEELALDRTKLAELRSDLAQNRTLQAAERTYAAWVRTGFTIAGAGWTLGQALQNSESREVALLLGGALIILGLMCFVFAWYGFKSVFDYLKETFEEDEKKAYPFKTNLVIVSILSFSLFVIFVFAFGMMIF